MAGSSSKEAGAAAPASTVSPKVPVKKPTKCFLLRVLSEAPIDQVTLGGRTFVKESNPVAGFNSQGKVVRRHVEGGIEPMTEDAVAKVIADMELVFLRFRRVEDRVVGVEVIKPTEGNPMDPETDVTVKQFIEFREVPRPEWWDNPNLK